MKPYRNEYRPHWRGPRGSYYGRGGVKFAILGLLKEKPRHGYDIIREMEERSGGVYSPSPGVIYPTLQALEDQDYIRSSEEDGKKIYAITEAGLAYLQENIDQTRARSEAAGAWAEGEPGEKTRESYRQHKKERREGSRGHCDPRWVHDGPAGPGGFFGPAGGPGAWGAWFVSGGGPELMRELRWTFQDFAGAVQRTVGDPEKVKEIREVLRDAKRKIDDIVMR